MKPEDIELHALVIRLLKGIVNAYEAWFNKRRNQPI